MCPISPKNEKETASEEQRACMDGQACDIDGKCVVSSAEAEGALTREAVWQRKAL